MRSMVRLPQGVLGMHPPFRCSGPHSLDHLSAAACVQNLQIAATRRGAHFNSGAAPPPGLPHCVEPGLPLRLPICMERSFLAGLQWAGILYARFPSMSSRK